MALNAAREAIETAVDARQAQLERAELDRALTEDVVDVTLPGERAPARAPAPDHPDPARRSRTRSSGSATRSATTVRWRRPSTTSTSSRSTSGIPRGRTRATFFFDETGVLRTETSPSQIHALEEHEPPIYMVSIGRCYRRDAIDATHYPVFHQFEGLAVDRGMTLADLKGTLLHVMRALYGPDRRVRFRTHYFPFTEPSMEPDVSCGICGGEGCRTCKYSGWLEMGGSGMVDPRVFENVGIDPNEWSGFAFGCGIERVAQLKYDFPDIRPLWDGDLRVLRQF